MQQLQEDQATAEALVAALIECLDVIAGVVRAVAWSVLGSPFLPSFLVTPHATQDMNPEPETRAWLKGIEKF